MSRRFILAMSAATLFATAPAWAQDIAITDAYARSASAGAKSGAAFLVIENHSGQDDVLTGVSSPVAIRVELHTHEENDLGVMRMIHVEEGFALPGGGMIMMRRGAEHVMFMGLTGPFVQGEMIPLTLIFETAGEMDIEVPVDLERKPGQGHKQGAVD